MKNNPLLSVIMPNYNDGAYISEALDAILSQSYRPMEVIIIDDGSTDNSLEIINEYARKNPIIRVIVNEKNMGVIASLKFGLEAAGGNYVYTASANDKVLPGFFDELMSLLIKHPDAGLCHSDSMALEKPKHIMSLGEETFYFTPNQLREKVPPVLGLFDISGGNSIVKKGVFIEYFDLFHKLKWSADAFVLFVIGIRYGICYVPKVLWASRQSLMGYSAKGVSQWKYQKEIFDYMFNLISSPEYSDIGDWIKANGICPPIEWDIRIMPYMLYNPRYREFLSFRLARRILWYSVKNRVSHFAPKSVKKLYRDFKNRYRRYRHSFLQQ